MNVPGELRGCLKSLLLCHAVACYLQKPLARLPAGWNVLRNGEVNYAQRVALRLSAYAPLGFAQNDKLYLPKLFKHALRQKANLLMSMHKTAFFIDICLLNKVFYLETGFWRLRA
ncbi:hypothetical protein CK510_21610 [Brunnivagina elsteri CCALA 953]|uniref:Uncharacterized protein n=1 Tax=Brunnivagina elsteri CCALA 953 TaxID=987040 RepID=A0A2A2TE40_9CYAN|nr:hypothetical protein CK510_21610 [Calothrix elsteri CCALA 953]